MVDDTRLELADACRFAPGIRRLFRLSKLKLEFGHKLRVLIPEEKRKPTAQISFFLLAKAVNTLGIGLSYAVFTGIGVVGTTLISIFVLKEGASLLKMLSLGVLIIGILGLKLCDKEGEEK